MISSKYVLTEVHSYNLHVPKVSLMLVYCSAPSVKYYYDVAMVHTDGSQKQAVLLLTGMV